MEYRSSFLSSLGRQISGWLFRWRQRRGGPYTMTPNGKIVRGDSSMLERQ